MGYELYKFNKNKAFIHFEGFINNEFNYGPRICINTKGEKLFELPDRDMLVDEFEDEDIAFVVDYARKYAMLNSKGEFLTDFVYDIFYGGSEEGLFEAKRNGKHGHVDINGKEVIPCIYDDGCYFSEGVAAEYLNGKCGMVDYFNNTVIPFEYEEICICKNNLINAKKNGKYGLINKNNEVVVDFIYDEIDCWNTRRCNIYPAMLNDKYGLIDRYGNIVEPFIYEDAQVVSDLDDNFGEYIYLLKEEDGKAIYSVADEKFLTDFIYDNIDYVSENRFLVYKDGKAGFIDIYGNEVTPLIFDQYTRDDFNNGYASVCQNGKFGMINYDGDLVIPCMYYLLDSYKGGLIRAIDDNNDTGFIDIKNNIVIPFGKFYTHSNFECGLVAVHSKEYGNVYIDKNGDILELKV